MYKKILLVEDGSIPEGYLNNTLEQSGNTDILVLPYRQGTAKPELVDLNITKDDAENNIKEQCKEKAISAFEQLLAKAEIVTNSNLDDCFRTIITSVRFNGAGLSDLREEFNRLLEE